MSNINFQRILPTETDSQAFAWAMDLLTQSFPLSERRTEQSQKAVLTHPDYRLCIATDGDVRLGVVGYFQTPNFIYFENFCTSPSVRNKGYGGKILHALVNLNLTLPLILEAELPTDELTARRINFYKRNGMVQNNFNHIQPHYHLGDDDLPLVILTYGKPISNSLYQDFAIYLKNNVDINGKYAKY